MEKNVPIGDDLFDAQQGILSRERTFQDWPKKSDASTKEMKE